ncbi:ComF family protein [Fodinibacter luteus]|uniref:ComF family protein n=1 Tax=Fodinibacter luteus TaxID=552064 RepID=A0ABP8KJE5_9MICO
MTADELGTGAWWSQGRLLRGLAAAGELVLPARCAACHGVGAPLCRACTAGLRTASHDGGPALVRLRSPPPGMPPCWSAARFEGALRFAVTAYKDEDRRDLRPALARLLATALATAVATDPGVRRRAVLGERVAVVPLPTARSSRRRRGDDPVADLARDAVSLALGAGPVRTGPVRTGPVRIGPVRIGPVRAGPVGALVVLPALSHTRVVADQAHLNRQARAANLAGAMTLLPAWRDAVRGAACVLVDDVVTTGSTLAEAARALRSAGAEQVVAATVAATTRRW